MSLDGSWPDLGHTMDVMDGTTVREGLHQESIDTTGAIIAGRDGGDRRPGQVQVTIPASPGQWPPSPRPHIALGALL